MPKPILSDSLFNADDVATAILNEANLQIANSTFAVTDIKDQFTTVAGYSRYEDCVFYAFNGFVFLAVTFNSENRNVIYDETFMSVTSTYAPITKTPLISVSYQGDTAFAIYANTNGDFTLSGPTDVGSATSYYIAINGFYRYA